MTDWSKDLSAALDSGDAGHMRAMLSQVPREAMRQIVPVLEHMAETSEHEGRVEEALFYRDRLVDAVPAGSTRGNSLLAARARLRLGLQRYAEALEDAQHLSTISPDNALGHRLAGEAHEGLDDVAQALAAYRRALHCAPDDALAARVSTLDEEIRKAAVLRQALDPEAAQEPLRIELPPPPDVRFDPALFDDPSMPAGSNALRIEGITRHLWRYSAQSSARNAIQRLADPVWRSAWDTALVGSTGARMRFVGSELGVLALRALHHGAAHALCAERYPQDARIATGMVQKHFLAPWHAMHGDAIQHWSEDERRASFETFAAAIDISGNGEDAAIPECDVLVFPQIDHTLLGTGIVGAVRACCGDGRAAPRVLPARATLYAMAVRWDYPDAADLSAGSALALDAINRLRWSAYPQPLELEAEFWTALTAPVEVGALDFANFTEVTWNLSLPAIADGHVDAILVWFEAELGEARISSAPDSDLRCIRPAVYYTDPTPLRRGESLALHIEAQETRLHVRPSPPRSQPRAHALPTWYVPMLGDVRRNIGYRKALHTALAAAPSQLALDIGAGFGLLSMFATQAGAARVIGCEQHPIIAGIGREVVAANGWSDRISLIAKECRALTVPDDLPARADLAIFELFDCSLIGEGVLHFLAYAREHLLAADARYLPAGARLRAMAVEYRIDRILDVDATLLNPYRASPNFINVDARTLDYRALSAPFDLFDFDFATAGPAAQELAIDVPAIADGSVGAILFWFDLRLDADTVLSNAPDGGDGLHWKQGLQFLPEARVAAGQTLPLVAHHNGSGLRLQWQPDGLPAEAFSRMPRFDPRWLAASSELEQQTRNLLQHCAQNPDEFAQVAQIAQRMAIDPARYDLDPVIAQRFMSMFFAN